MRLYRGISVPAANADSIISAISREGLAQGVGWMMIWEKVDDPLQLLEKPDLSLTDTRGPYESLPVAICACGEPRGAELYAWVRNKSKENDTPIVIEIEVDPSNVAVDGRDFLYTTFGLGSRTKTSEALSKLFGPAVLEYAHRAWNSDDSDRRIALCDLAIHDQRVVSHHYCNQLVIGGRHRTLFRNAFKIRLPIPAAAIVKVSRLTAYPGAPPVDIHLQDVIR